MSTSQRNAPPLNFLSLDGGGVRGVSELVILDRIMRRLQEKGGLSELPKPCDYFDLMAGTSTGGLIALLLGRLQMTTQEALATYGRVSRRVFGFKNRKPSPECQFKASTLADAVREIVEQRGRGDVLLDPLASQRKGKAFVCASDTADLDVVQLFRTYETRDGTDEWLKDCKIWEAARATTAAPTFFKPIEITGDEVKRTFMDGAVSCNNPADKLLEEAGRVFNSRRKVGVILSLGTGTKSKSMPTGASTLGFVGGLLKMLKNQAVDTERVHHALRSKFEQSPNTYFRFNVPGGGEIGLAEWNKMGTLTKLTEDYLKDPAVVEEIEAIADVLARKATSGITVARVSCLTRDDPDLETCRARPMGSASQKFVGRRDILERMDDFFSPRETGSRGRREFLLCGMGGAGKTQIALKFAENTGQRFKHVFWVDAENLQTALQSFRDIASSESSQERTIEPSMEAVRRWIASLREEWLLILDNSAAEFLEQIVPVGNRGNIIHTSRDQKVVPDLPDAAIAHVHDLQLDDAITLLLRAASLVPYSPAYRDEARPVVTELGCLALAVDQAGSYIFMQGCTPADYLQELRKRRAELLRDERYMGHDRRSQTVYATFDISFRAIKALASDQEGHFEAEDARNALKILEIICFYHNERIPEEIFKRAAINYSKRIRRGADHPLSDGRVPLESLLEAVKVEQDWAWNPMPFRFGAMLLEQFSLIKGDRLRQNLSLHILISSWAGDRMEPDYRVDRILCAKSVMACAIPVSEKPEPWDAVFRRKLYPHLKALQQYEDVRYPDVSQGSSDSIFGRLAEEAGDYVEAERLYKRAIEALKLEYGRDDKATHKALRALAGLYEKQGRFAEAEGLLLEARDIVEYIHGPDSLTTVDAWLSLANTYKEQVRLDAWENAVLQAKQRMMRYYQTSDPNHEKLAHINGLLTQLGNARLGISEEATIEELQAELDRCLRHYDKLDQRTLQARSQLGEALRLAGRLSEADDQLMQAANGYANRHGCDDPRYILAASRFAILRCAQGCTLEAETILRDCLARTKKLRGNRDIKALEYLYTLGHVIASQIRFDEGILLMEKARDLLQALVGADYLVVKKANNEIAEVIELASSISMTQRRELFRSAFESNPGSWKMDDAEIDRWCTLSYQLHLFSQLSRPDRPDLDYLSEHEKRSRTRFPHLFEPLPPETQLEMPIELLNVQSEIGVAASDEFA